MKLEFLADFLIDVAAPITIGETAEGLRRIVPILGGRISGPRLSGTILPAGADYQLIRPDGYTTLDARYTARLDDGAMLYIVNIGVRFGPPDHARRAGRSGGCLFPDHARLRDGLARPHLADPPPVFGHRRPPPDSHHARGVRSRVTPAQLLKTKFFCFFLFTKRSAYFLKLSKTARSLLLRPGPTPA